MFHITTEVIAVTIKARHKVLLSPLGKITKLGSTQCSTLKSLHPGSTVSALRINYTVK